mgnify:FL=1
MNGNRKPLTGEGRTTRQKLLIAQILREAGCPLTAGEIYVRAAGIQPQLAKSTVYRNLEAMLARGEVINGRLDDGESYYAPAGEHGHRHFMICRACHRMLDLPECPLGDLERRLAQTEGFTVTEHVVQLYGYCRACEEKRRKKENASGHKDENPS